MKELQIVDKLLKRDAVKGLAELRKIVESLKNMNRKDKAEVLKWLKKIQYIYKDVFVELFYEKSILQDDDLKELARGSEKMFNRGKMGVSAFKSLTEVMKLIDTGDIEDAVMLVKRTARTVQFRAETLVNTARLGRSRSGTFDDAKDDDVFEYRGPKLNARKVCSLWLEKKRFTFAEIKQLDNGQKLPVRTFCGGYNCRHRFIKII